MPDKLGARAAIDRRVRVTFPDDAPPLTGAPTPARLWRLARYLRGFDLVLTYNWGAFDAVMARRLFAKALKLPPLVHHEDGFNEDEAARLNPRRNRYRRLGLPGASRLVVPSARLERIAREQWGTPAVRIPNGVPVARFLKAPETGAIPGFERRPGEVVIGTVAGLRAVKNLPRLVRAFAGMSHKAARLVIVGEGPESERIAAEARARGVAGARADAGLPRRSGALDRACSTSSPCPRTASNSRSRWSRRWRPGCRRWRPRSATSARSSPTDNAPLIVEPGDEAAFAAALDSLAEQPHLRRAIGDANREKALADYDEAEMIAAYARLYGEAVGRPDAFTANRMIFCVRGALSL